MAGIRPVRLARLSPVGILMDLVPSIGIISAVQMCIRDRNIESDSKGGVRQIAEQLNAFLQTCEGVDLSPMENFLNK